ncbi:MAG: hypothetical protein V6Z86_08185 [Hyphomicrobiales bacterium]
MERPVVIARVRTDHGRQIIPRSMTYSATSYRSPLGHPPDEAGALDTLQSLIELTGFACHRLPFQAPGTRRVDNPLARIGNAQGGPISALPTMSMRRRRGMHPCGRFRLFPARWATAWFTGAVDMTDGVAASVAAALGFVEARGARWNFRDRLVITRDEEGPAHRQHAEGAGMA